MNAAKSLVEDLQSKMARSSDNQKMLIAAAAALLFIIVPMDMAQLVFTVLGAAAYYALQQFQRLASNEAAERKGSSKSALFKSSRSQSRSRDFSPDEGVNKPFAMPSVRKEYSGHLRRTPKDSRSAAALSQPKSTSQAPIAAPTFKGVGFEAEVSELLGQLMPTTESDKAVGRLAEAIRYLLASVMPEVEVVGFASADLSRGRAFGVAVPDVDIVINVNPDALAQRMKANLSSQGKQAVKMDAQKLRKSAVRMCTDRLVNVGGFKFRRSAFRGDEPKVTLLAPTELGIFSEAIPLDLSVNSLGPLHSAALLTECGQIDIRAKELLVLVRRWAKDRGICHHPKGFFTPFVWSLLAVYYLQVTDQEEKPILPPLQEFEATSRLMKGTAKTEAGAGTRKVHKPSEGSAEGKKTVSSAKLLQGFFEFYVNFDWSSKCICPRLGQKDSQPHTLPIHIIVKSDGASEAGPSVEDPFEPSNNFGSCMNEWSFKRTKEELQRASSLLTREPASLSQLLEPWTPAAGEAQMDVEDNEQL